MATMNPDLMSSCAAPLLMSLSVTIFSVDLAFATGWKDGPVSRGLLIFAFSIILLFAVGLASEKSSGSGVGIRNLAGNLSVIVKILNDLRGIAVSHKYSALPQYESYPYFQTLAQPAAADDPGVTAADSDASNTAQSP
ncbi:hypothetical protein DEU56DRAFT_911280 [Suillus clintonianus]|uniref:uncharacterized protein n=1 Tax=Suillus clintonianus TaxID=1904413 RepID=UPI001B878362|nr:uncharacterized protein DEU56DRAFT_911280 [Suillus clintonianus]KAG2141949.1 hypothetical protein DEU56DRAFT_911280 [Suillus clintonianus]